MKPINQSHKMRPVSLLWLLPIIASGVIYVGCGGSDDSSSTSASPSPSPTLAASPSPSPEVSPSPVISPSPVVSPSPTTVSITVVGMNFGSPITVKSGTAVTWQNASGLPHNVIWDSRSPDTSTAPGANIPTFNGGANSQPWVAPTVTTNTTYDYHCGIHGPMMSGQITVTP